MKLSLKLLLLVILMITIQPATSKVGQNCNTAKPCPINFTCVSGKCQLTATLPINTPSDQYYYSISRSIRSF